VATLNVVPETLTDWLKRARGNIAAFISGDYQIRGPGCQSSAIVPPKAVNDCWWYCPAVGV